jgi:hypothetical protein
MLKDDDENNQLFDNMKESFPRKYIFADKFNNLKNHTKKFFGGKLAIFISDDESYENIGFLLNSDFVSYIFVYTNNEEKFENIDILLNSSKYIGFSKNHNDIRKKIEEQDEILLKKKLKGKNNLNL